MSGDKGRAAAGKGVECEAEGRGRVSRAAASRRLRLRRGAAGRAVRGARGDSFGVSGPRRFPAAWGRPAAGGGVSRLGGSWLGSARGVPAWRGHPEEFWGGPRGSIFPACP